MVPSRRMSASDPFAARPAANPNRPNRSALGRALATAVGVAVLAIPLLVCNSSSPVDMWIGKDPDAGAGFEAPVREAGTDADDSGATGGDDGGTAGTTGGAGTTGAGGTMDTAGTSGGAGAGAGGAAGATAGAGGSGGSAGAGGAAGA